jgi:putative PIN family toxin of toxin-antitoxin system
VTLIIVVDTNVVVSAMMTPGGIPNRVLQAVLEDEVHMAYSLAILAEYRSVLARPRFGFDSADIASLTAYVETFGHLVAPSPSEVSMRDQTDRVFYDAARVAGAILVTGNTRDFPTADWIVTPAAFSVAHLPGR